MTKYLVTNEFLRGQLLQSGCSLRTRVDIVEYAGLDADFVADNYDLFIGFIQWESVFKKHVGKYVTDKFIENWINDCNKTKDLNYCKSFLKKNKCLPKKYEQEIDNKIKVLSL